MRKLFDFAFSVVLIVFVGNASAITDTFDVGGGAVIPLPPGEWHVLQDSNSDWGNGRRLVLGAKDVSSEIPLLAFAYTQSGQRWSNDPECFSYSATNKVPYVALYGSKPGALKQKCAIIWGSSVSFSQTQTRLLNRGNAWWTEANPGLSKGAFTGSYSETEIHLRDFGRRNFSMNIFVRNPSQKYVGGNYREAEASYEKWLAVYVDALQKAFQEKLSPKKIAAIDFYRNDVSASMDKAEREPAEKKLLAQERLAAEQKAQEERQGRLAAEQSAQEQATASAQKLIEEERQGRLAAEQSAQEQATASAQKLIEEERQGRLAAEQSAQEQAKQLLEQQAELLLMRERLAAQKLLEKERLVLADMLKDQRAARDKAEQEKLAGQKLLEQERLVAEQKAQEARLGGKEAEIALLRAQLDKKIKQNVGSSNIVPGPAANAQAGNIAPVNPNRRKALVFGNDNYTAISPLQNAVADGQAMASKLKGLGYAVTERYDASRREMLSTMRNFSGRVQGGDEVIFFYAGHGVELDGRNYLLPIDIHGDDSRQVRDDAIELQRILSDMADNRAKFTLAVVDACRDNPFASSGRAIGGRGLAPTTAATGQMVIFSAGTGQQALDRLDANDKNPNGLFTRIFMEEMSEPNVPIDRVVKKVRQKVFQAAQTVGHEQVPAIYDQVVGDFFFVKK